MRTRPWVPLTPKKQRMLKRAAETRSSGDLLRTENAASEVFRSLYRPDVVLVDKVRRYVEQKKLVENYPYRYRRLDIVALADRFRIPCGMALAAWRAACRR